MNLKTTTFSFFTALALAAGLTACSFEEPTIAEAPVADQPAGDSVEQPAPAPEPEPTPEELEGVGAFGEIASWDGVDVTITAPKPFEPSEWAAGAETYPNSVAVDITLTNTGNAPLDPSMSYLTASSGGAEASEIFDTDNGADGSPMTSILPGKSVTWTAALNVSDPADVVIEFTPDFDFESVLFVTGGDL